MVLDFTHEPRHSTDLVKVQSKEPFNAEPNVETLIQYEVTPERLVYCRNHGPICLIDDKTYSLRVGDKAFRMDDLRHTFKNAQVVAAMQCAGNRRNEMSVKIKEVEGIGWDDAVIANCRWGGALLRDVLKAAYTQSDIENAKHVCFSSSRNVCQDESWFGASIPISRAMSLEDDVLLAYEMNGMPLTADRGGPVRLVVPGFVGARWVKWLDKITLSSAESPNFYQQKDYKVLPPHVESKENLDWSKYPAMKSLPLNSVVASVTRQEDTLVVKGYATASYEPNVNIASVHVSVDDGQSWVPAEVSYQEGRWSWTLWEARITGITAQSGEVLSRATDTTGEEQPEQCTWNLRGVAYNGWGRKAW